MVKDPVPIDFDAEDKRIRNKIWEKTRKFTEEDICLLAIDCSLFPEIGTGWWNTVDRALRGPYRLTLSDDVEETARLAHQPGGLWARDEARRKLNALIKFQTDYCILRPDDCHAVFGASADGQKIAPVVDFVRRLCGHVDIHRVEGNGSWGSNSSSRAIPE